LPLISKGCCTRGGHRKTGRLARCDSLARWLANDARCYRIRIDGQGRAITGDVTGRIGNNNREQNSIVRRRLSGGRIAGGGSARNVCSILAPLIAQRRGAASNDRKLRCLTCKNSLIGRLCSNGRSHRRRCDRKHGQIAGYVTGRIADGYTELRTVVGNDFRRRRVAGRRCASYAVPIFVPLITQRRGT